MRVCIVAHRNFMHFAIRVLFTPGQVAIHTRQRGPSL
jgi:hypothetical protein